MITRETDYALRLLRTLQDGERHTASEAAEREMVPSSFAYKILKKLARAGFVEIIRGTDGGCRLTADLGKVTLYDLMMAMGENCRLSSCMDPGYSCAWRLSHGAVRFTAIWRIFRTRSMRSLGPTRWRAFWPRLPEFFYHKSG